MPSPAPAFSPGPHSAITCEGRELVKEHLPVGYYSLITQDKKKNPLGFGSLLNKLCHSCSQKGELAVRFLN